MEQHVDDGRLLQQVGIFESLQHTGVDFGKLQRVIDGFGMLQQTGEAGITQGVEDAAGTIVIEAAARFLFETGEIDGKTAEASFSFFGRLMTSEN